MTNHIKAEFEDRKRESGLSREKERKDRTPLYENSSMTLMNRDPNYHYRVVNDMPGRIDRFLAAGYEFAPEGLSDTYSGVGRDEGVQAQTTTKLKVNFDPSAEVKNAYLMRIPLELFEQDQKAKQDQVDQEIVDIDKDGEIMKAILLGSRANITNAVLNKRKLNK